MVKTVLLRRREVEARTGLSRSTIYQKVADGEFPARGRVRLSRRDRHFEGFAKQCCGGFFRGAPLRFAPGGVKVGVNFRAKGKGLQAELVSP